MKTKRRRKEIEFTEADGVEAGYCSDCRVVHLWLFKDGQDEPFAQCSVDPQQLRELVRELGSVSQQVTLQ
jgi:hypothetical protein